MQKLWMMLAITLSLVSVHSPANERHANMTVMIPMRDGTELPTDIYLPTDNSESLPCILLRSPAGQHTPFAKAFLPLTEVGYIVAIQATRSALDEEGKTLPYASDGWGEQQDGYDTVEWLAQSPLTNGEIGTLGFSAMGITQMLLAPTAPPSLKCQYVGVAASSLYHHAMFPGGQLRKGQVEGWLGLYANDPGVHCFVVNQPFFNDFWQEYDSTRVAHQVEVPGIHYGGWFDTFLQGTIDGFVSRQENGGEGARGEQKLVIGPWAHFWPQSKHFGDFEVPHEGRTPPFDLSPRAWFDFHMKGIQNDIATLAPVTYYVMGPFDGSPSSGNVWRTSEVWPVPAVETPLYLTTTGKLIEKNPPTEEGVIRYVSDPNNPVPTIGGNNLFLESGPKDQRPIEDRKDVMVFTTEPLEEDIEVSGRMYANLLFSADQRDTDIVVRLCDVYPDGRSILISDGIFRTGFCHCSPSSDPSQPHEVAVDLWSTSIVFAKGHRIRIDISGTNYPRYERNSNVGLTGTHGGKFEIANHKIHVGGRYGSSIVLPVVRKGNRWLLEERPTAR